ncbi:PHP domain-containing protein [uncultured Desulfobacter sp.]|uniref:PHP domain-containing protein n=1 Tax=uncultured Desulfobacter sp. TaxID=240139 RepID=UPI0029F53C3A|nr:PHP domain-containing protein [uncultured Desulfobacter sp.]
MSRTSYIDLHIHSEYTQNNGLSTVPALVERAVSYNMDALAITDSGNVSGVPEFYEVCIRSGIKPIIGLGFYFADDSRFAQSTQKYHLVLLAENNIGFMHLLELAERSFTQGFYKRPRIDFELLETYYDGLICLTGGLGGVVDKYLYANKKNDAVCFVQKCLSLFGDDHFFLELQDNGLKKNQEMIAQLLKLSKETGAKCVVSGGSFYVDRKDAFKCNQLRQAHGNNPLDGDGYYFKSPEEMSSLFSMVPHAVQASRAIADRCAVLLNMDKCSQIPRKDDDLSIIRQLQGCIMKA